MIIFNTRKKNKKMNNSRQLANKMQSFILTLKMPLNNDISQEVFCHVEKMQLLCVCNLSNVN